VNRQFWLCHYQLSLVKGTYGGDSRRFHPRAGHIFVGQDLILFGQVTNLTERQQHQTEHPMPTSKKQLRTPKLLDNISKTVTKMIEQIAQKKLAA
jgi:hypothetical protein